MFRKARLEDLDLIEDIAKSAIAFLKDHGIDQWNNGYPNKEVFLEDIKLERGFLLDDIAYVAIILDGDPNYLKINGAWHQDAEYAALHRTMVKSALTNKGNGKRLFLSAQDYIKKMGYEYIRIDTHKDNFIMRHLLEKLDYKLCGTITLAYDKSKREAYDKLL